MAFRLEEITLKNKDYRRVISTGDLTQLVVMSINHVIPWEVHEETEQFIRVEKGLAEVDLELEGEELSYLLADGDSITIPPGTRHRVSNRTPNSPVKLYTIYSPPHHAPGLIQQEEDDYDDENEEEEQNEEEDYYDEEDDYDDENEEDEQDDEEDEQEDEEEDEEDEEDDDEEDEE